MSALTKGCRAFVKYTDGQIDYGYVQSIVLPDPNANPGSIASEGSVYIWLDHLAHISCFPYADVNLAKQAGK